MVEYVRLGDWVGWDGLYLAGGGMSGFCVSGIGGPLKGCGMWAGDGRVCVLWACLVVEKGFCWRNWCAAAIGSAGAFVGCKDRCGG